MQQNMAVTGPYACPYDLAHSSILSASIAGTLPHPRAAMEELCRTVGRIASREASCTCKSDLHRVQSCQGVSRLGICPERLQCQTCARQSSP